MKKIKAIKAWGIVGEYGLLLRWPNMEKAEQLETYTTKKQAEIVLKVWQKNWSSKCRIIPVLISPLPTKRKKK